MSYPTDLNPTLKTDWANNTPVENTHPEEHNDVALNVEALKAKVGADSSAVTTSHDYKLGEVISTDKAVGKTATQTLTNKTLTAPKLENGGFIADANGNELIEGTTTASATNHVGITNNSTGNDPLIEAKGSDTNINLALKGKGSGSVKIGTAGLKFPNTDGSADNVLQTDGSGNLSFAPASSESSFTATAGEDLTADDAVIIAAGSESAVVTAISTTNTVEDTTNGWWYQSFVTGPNTHSIMAVTMRVNTGGGASAYTYRIRATPSGSDLGSIGSGTLNVGDSELTLTFASPVTVSPSTTYYIVVTGPRLRGGTTSSYSGGVSGTSADAGVNWTTPATTVTGDFYFKVFEGYCIAGRAYKTSADSSLYISTNWQTNFVGFAKTSVSATASVSIQVNNVYSSLSGLTAGLTYYLSNTAGVVASSAGTVSKKIGLAVSTTGILIKHDN